MKILHRNHNIGYIIMFFVFISSCWHFVIWVIKSETLFCLSALTDDGSFPYKTKHEQRHRVALTECFTEADLRGLPELNPPALMPNGNVGTPVKVFLQLIQCCRLPPRLIPKLGLTFPKTGSNRRYGNVPFQYRNTQMLPATEETVLTAAGHEICGPGSFTAVSKQRHRQSEEHTQKKGSQEEEEKEEEEQEQSEAEDVGFTHRHARVQVHTCIHASTYTNQYTRKHRHVHVYTYTLAQTLAHTTVTNTV